MNASSHWIAFITEALGFITNRGSYSSSCFYAPKWIVDLFIYKAIIDKHSIYSFSLLKLKFVNQSSLFVQIELGEKSCQVFFIPCIVQHTDLNFKQYTRTMEKSTESHLTACKFLMIVLVFCWFIYFFLHFFCFFSPFLFFSANLLFLKSVLLPFLAESPC